MKTKEEILEKHYKNYKKRIAYDENVLAAMEEYAQEVVKNNAVLPLVNGWLDFESNKELFNEEAKKNCLCKFEDGTIIRYYDEHPMEIMTHFKLAEACR